MTLEKLNKARDALLEALHTDKPILLMSSGGSALCLLDVVTFSDNITLTVLDERYQDESNFKQVVHYTNRIIDPRAVGGESLEETAQRFENNINKWRKTNPNGKIVITQGMGADCHTAGIFPQFRETKKLVVGYVVDANPFPNRITVTPYFLRNEVDSSIVFISGDSKKEALQKVLEEHGDLSQTPARIMREMKNITIFTDIDFS